MVQFSSYLYIISFTCLHTWVPGITGIPEDRPSLLVYVRDVSNVNRTNERWIVKWDSISPIEFGTHNTSWDMSIATNKLTQRTCWVSTHTSGRDIISCTTDLSNKDLLTYPNVPRGNSYQDSKKSPWSLELSPFGDHLFWQSVDAGGLFVTNIATNASLLYLKTSEDNSITFFTVDWFNGIIFWVNENAESSIKKSDTKLEADSYSSYEGFDSTKPVRGITVNTANKTLYWITDTSIWQKGYHETKSYQLINVNSPVRNSLKYFEKRLVWIEGGTRGSTFIITYDLKEQSKIEYPETDPLFRIEGGVFFSRRMEFLAILEDETNGRKDACKELQCSHLCLPIKNGKHRCACPWGLELKGRSECGGVSVAVALADAADSKILIQDLNSTGKAKSAQVHSITAAGQIHQIFSTEKSKDTFCYTRGVDKGIACVDSTSDTEYTLKGVDVLSRLGDSYSVVHMRVKNENDYILWLGRSTGPDCLKYVESKFGKNWTLPCIEGIDFNFPVVVDEDAWLIFWRNSSHIHKTNVWGNVTKMVSPIGPTQNEPSMAVDTENKKLFFFHDKLLHKTDYDGNFVLNFSYKWEVESVSSLIFEKDRLYYIEHWKTEDYVVTIDAELKVKDRILRRTVGTSFKYLAVQRDPSERRKTSCYQSPCSHFCLAVNKTKFYCRCPSELPYLFNGKTCKRPEIIVLSSYFMGGQRQEIVSLPTNTNTKIQPIHLAVTVKPAWILGNAKTQLLCWNNEPNSLDYAVCKMIDKDDKYTELSRPYPIFLAMNPKGDEIYWRVAEDGCIKISKFSSSSKLLKETFEDSFTTSVCEGEFKSGGKTAVDTSRGIVFWVVGNSIIHYRSFSNSSDLYNRSRSYDGLARKTISSIAVDEFKGILYAIVDHESIQSVSYSQLVGNAKPTKVCTFSKLKSHDLQYNSGYLFWIGEEVADKSIIQVYRLYDDGSGENLHTTLNDSLKILKMQIFEPIEEEYTWDNPCLSNPCSHFCLIDNPLNFKESSVAKCYCPKSYKGEHAPSCDTIFWHMLIGGAGVLLAIVVISALTYCYCRIRKMPKKIRPPKPTLGCPKRELKEAIKLFLEGDANAAARAPDAVQRARFLPFDKVIRPDEKSVDYHRELGSGNFGAVYSGTYEGQPVAVKTFKEGLYLDLNAIFDFMKELKVMAYIGNHDNIVRFLGADVTNMASSGKIEVVLELSPQGSLDLYLRKCCKTFRSDVVRMSDLEDEFEGQACGPRETLTFADLLSYSTQIADGMHYLEQKHVIHGDLATRNVLVFDGGRVVKISDFGFARNLYGNSLYRPTTVKKLPYRWAAIETLEHFNFTTMADVWSYGVTLWEIFTLGTIPFLNRGWDEEFIAYLKAGNRLLKPDFCPQYIYKDILLRCWDLDPTKRPSFEYMSAYFWNIQEELETGGLYYE